MQRLILFVNTTNEHCLKAMKLSSTCDTMITIDIEKLSHIPRWIRGVPSLLDQKTSTLFEGTQCLEYLHDLNPEPVISFPMNLAVHADATTIESYLESHRQQNIALSPIEEHPVSDDVIIDIHGTSDDDDDQQDESEID